MLFVGFNATCPTIITCDTVLELGFVSTLFALEESLTVSRSKFLSSRQLRHIVMTEQERDDPLNNVIVRVACVHRSTDDEL